MFYSKCAECKEFKGGSLLFFRIACKHVASFNALKAWPPGLCKNWFQGFSFSKSLIGSIGLKWLGGWEARLCDFMKIGVWFELAMFVEPAKRGS